MIIVQYQNIRKFYYKTSLKQSNQNIDKIAKMKSYFNLKSQKKQILDKNTETINLNKFRFNIPNFMLKNKDKINQSSQNSTNRLSINRNKCTKRLNITERDSFSLKNLLLTRYSGNFQNFNNLTQNFKTKQNNNEKTLSLNQTNLISPLPSTMNIKKIKNYKCQKNIMKTQQNQNQKQNSTNFNQQRDYCKIKIIKSIDKSTQTKPIQQFIYKVSTTNNLTQYLVGKLQYKTKNSIYFQCEPQNIVLDLFLTLQDCDISYLNGTSLKLKMIQTREQKKVNINSFQILKCIGYGGFSKVFLCRFKADGKIYAMKIIDKNFIVSTKKTKIIMNQKNSMQMLSHPFLIEMKFAFETLNNIIFILEYCPGGEMFSQIKKNKRMNESTARFYMIQILIGLQYIHKEGIIYRDFKPENILLDINGNVKIADFGLAKPNYYSLKDRAFSFCGSPQYMPPEMILRQGHSLAVDFYCLGAVLYEFVTGLPPFYSSNAEQIYQSTVNQEIQFPHDIQLSYQLKSLLKGLLCKNQKFRLGSMFGVKQVLSHPWFKKFSKQKYLQKKIKTPVCFTSIDQIKIFNEQLIKQNQTNVNLAKKQQEVNLKYRGQTFKKQFKDFQYDYREPFGKFKDQNQQKNTQSSDQKGFNKVKKVKFYEPISIDRFHQNKKNSKLLNNILLNAKSPRKRNTQKLNKKCISNLLQVTHYNQNNS